MKTFLSLLFLITFSFADFKLGIPSNAVNKTYTGLVEQLEKKGLIKKHSIEIVKVDILEKDIDKLRKEIESLDLFFLTGRYYFLYTNKIKPNVNTLVLASKKLHKIDEFYKDKLTGVFRLANINTLLDISRKIPGFNSKVGLLVKKDSPFSMTAKEVAKRAKESGVEIKLLKYGSKTQLEDIFKNNQGKINSIHLFPPSVGKELMSNVIDLQFKYKIPLIAQKESHVKQGVVFGYVLDYERILPALGSCIDKIASGINLVDMPPLFYENRYMVNINSISKMNLKIDKDILIKAEVVGILDKKAIKKKSSALKSGHYKIAVAVSSNKIYSYYLKHLKLLGYESGKNLTLKRFDPVNMDKAIGDVDLFLSTGNYLNKIVKIKGDTPLVFVSVNRMLKDLKKHNAVGVFRSSNVQFFDKLINMFPNMKKINIVFKKKILTGNDKEGLLKRVRSFYKNTDIILYSDINALENRLKKIDRDNQIVLLYPSSIPNGEIYKLIEIQNRYKLPIVSQSKHEVDKGIALGIAVDFNIIAKKLAYKTHKVLSGIKPQDSISDFVDTNYYINLSSLRKIDIELSKSVLRNADITVK